MAAGALDATTLDRDEQDLVDGVAARRDELVELACALIAFDTTSRAGPQDPPRDEAALQSLLADRLRARGADIDLWEPDPADVAGHPLSVPGLGFEGRPQLAVGLLYLVYLTRGFRTPPPAMYTGEEGETPATSTAAG